MILIQTPTLSKSTETTNRHYHQKTPFISAIMPIRNEEGFIEQSLRAVLAQNYPSDQMEIIVVDGMSTDKTREIVKKLQNDHPNITLLKNEQKFVSHALNMGIKKAQGDVIILVGGHCEIAPEYFLRCVEHLHNDGVDVVGGPIETIGETLMARTIATAMSSPFGVGGCAFRTKTGQTMLVDTVAFAAYKREIVERAGPFDEELIRNQDDEYNYRIRKMGGKIFLSPKIQSRYYSRGSLLKLWKQYFQYGYWKVRVTQKHPKQMKARHFIPAIFVFTLLFCTILSPFNPIAYIFFMSTAGLYLITNLCASLWASRKQGWTWLPSLPIVFATLHVSYGLGFLSGLIRFSNRWFSKKGTIGGIECK